MDVSNKMRFKLAFFLTLVGCDMLPQHDDLRLVTIEDAVNDRNVFAVERLILMGSDLETRDSVGATPLITACSSGQFRIAEVLIKGGANVFAVDSFGITAGRMAWMSRVSDTSAEGAARRQVLAMMMERGFPFPPPEQEAVLAAIAAGKWPRSH